MARKKKKEVDPKQYTMNSKASKMEINSFGEISSSFSPSTRKS